MELALFPVLVDSRPPYLREGAETTLLQMPLADGTVLTHIVDRLRQVTRRTPRVVRGFEAGDAYDKALRATGLVTDASILDSDLCTHLDCYEPSDWLMLIDARCLPLSGFDAWPLFEGLGETPRIARHLIALATNAAGTSERVEFDSSRRVRCVQRYYDSVTWTVARGVSCSLLPVSSLLMAPSLPFGSLIELRKALAGLVMPARDVPIRGAAVDLSMERGLLTLNERFLANRRVNGSSHRGVVHPTARLVGDVVLHCGTVIGERATVIGPTVVAEGASVGRGAVVAQCVIAPGVDLGEGVVARHRVVTTSHPEPPSVADAAISIEDDRVPISQENASQPWYPAVKWALEAIVVLIAVVLISPILLIIAVLVKLDSKGPALYGDPREAKGGRVFRCYKFRTMHVDAHAVQRELGAANQVDGPQFKMRSDPRVTRVGRWLRRTSLDELPQLFNVMMGNMSLVGPRPSPFRENQTCVPWREARLSVRPGITGLWQVCRHDREAGDFHQWIYYDIQYIRHQSFLVDLKILAATIWTGGGRTHVPLSWIISSVPTEPV